MTSLKLVSITVCFTSYVPENVNSHNFCYKPWANIGQQLNEQGFLRDVMIT
jgi:hypothetical protein